MGRIWASLVGAGVRHPVAAATITAVLTVAFALNIPRVRLDTSAEGFMVEHDPERALYDRFTHEFGTDTVTLVVLEAADVFRPEVLATVRDLTDRIAGLDGVTRIESLSTARRVRVEDEALETAPFIDALIPTDPARLDALRHDATSHRVLVDNLVAADGRATAILVYTETPPGDSHFNARFVDELEAVIAAARRPGLDIYEVGRPLLKATYSRFILRDMVRLVPVSAGVLLLALLLMFRTRDAVLVPLATVGVSIVWTFGLMGILGIPLTVLTAVIPALLVTIGFAEDVHVISGYHTRLVRGARPADALAATIDDTAAPLLVTTVTTVIGFASLAISDVTLLKQFGYTSAMALAANFVVTMLLLPPIVLALGRTARGGAIERRLGEHALLRALEWIGWFDVRHRVAILVTAGVLVGAGAVAAARIDVNTDFFSYFPAESAIRVRAAAAARALSGADTFWIVVDTGRADGIKEPSILSAIARLQRDLEARELVDKTVSIADHLATVRRQLRDGDVSSERIPDSAAEAAQYMLMMDAGDLASVVNADASATTIVVRHQDSGSARLLALQREIEALARAAFPSGVDVRSTGESILTSRAADYMAVNELTSFAFAFVAIGLVHSALFMSFRIGLLSLVPDVIPIVVAYGLMAAAGVPLSTGTALVATVAIGISVDDTVHHLMTYARALDDYVHPSLALFATLRTAGRAIVASSIALAAGFLVMLGSGFVPLQQFGAFAALAMLLALATELFVTPALMLTIRVATVWDLVQLKIDPKRLAAAGAFAGLSEWQLRKVILMSTLRSCPAGARVAGADDPAGGMFVVVTGEVAATDETGQPAGRYGPGAALGPTDSGETRPRDFVATAASELLVFDAAALERLRRRFPFTARKLARAPYPRPSIRSPSA